MFGISSAHEKYQNIIQQVLSGCKGVRNISDDIIVHSRNIEEHDQHLCEVLRILSEKGLTLNKAKCEFRLNKLHFMGHLLPHRGIGSADEKIKAIVNAKAPLNVSEVKSFLGLVTYSCHFIPEFATIAEPLHRLTRKGTTFNWVSEQEKAFNSLKMKLGKAETLTYFNANARTAVIEDASPVGLGAVLTQVQDGENRVVA